MGKRNKKNKKEAEKISKSLDSLTDGVNNLRCSLGSCVKILGKNQNYVGQKSSSEALEVLEKAEERVNKFKSFYKRNLRGIDAARNLLRVAERKVEKYEEAFIRDYY